MYEISEIELQGCFESEIHNARPVAVGEPPDSIYSYHTEYVFDTHACFHVRYFIGYDKMIGEGIVAEFVGCFIRIRHAAAKCAETGDGSPIRFLTAASG